MRKVFMVLESLINPADLLKIISKVYFASVKQ